MIIPLRLLLSRGGRLLLRDGRILRALDGKDAAGLLCSRAAG